MVSTVAPVDVDLARRCVSGDRKAQRDVFERHKRRVHGTLYRILGSNSDIEDLVQEAFVEIFRSLAGFRGEAQLSTWIDRITVRVAYGYFAKRRRDTVRLSVVPDLAAGDPSAEERAMAREAARRLYAVLDRIDPVHRIAFTLHVIDGRPLTEVATAMDASIVATKLRAWRCGRQIERHARKDPLLAGFVRPSSDAPRATKEED